MDRTAAWITCALLAALVCMEALKLSKVDDALMRNVYEYRIEYVADETFEEQLQRIGNEGWELVNARRARAEDEKFGYECILRKTRLVRQ